VWELFRARRLRVEDFVFDKGACLLAKEGRQAFYAGYELWVPPLRRYLRRQCYWLANGLIGRAPALAAGEGDDAD
jgi:hypothetical protein